MIAPSASSLSCRDFTSRSVGLQLLSAHIAPAVPDACEIAMFGAMLRAD